MFSLHIKFKKLLHWVVVVICFFHQIQAVECFKSQPLFDDQQEYNENELPLYSSLPFFEKRIINLPSVFNNKIPLNYDDLPQGTFVIEYQLDGVPVGSLTKTDSIMHFTAQGVQPYDFSLTTPVKTGVFIVETQGDFTFQKAIESQIAVISCKSAVFHDRLKSKQNFIVQAHSYNNYSDASCASLTFEGKHFYVLPKATLDVQEITDIISKESFINQGKVSLGQGAVIVTDSLENHGDFRTGVFNVTAKKFRNKGFVDVVDSFLGTCNVIENHGRWNIANNCILQKVKQFNSTHKSQWHIGNNLIANVDEFFLEGRSVVKNLALLRIGSCIRLGGSFGAHVFDLESNGLITSTPQARFFVKHYFGLKARGWIGYEGDVIEKSLIQDGVEPSLTQVNPLELQYPKGVFLESEQGGIKKSGDILATSGKVSLIAGKFVKDLGLIDAGSKSDAMILMHARDIILEKEAVLRASYVQLTAQDLVEQHGKILMEQEIAVAAPQVVHTGTSRAHDCVHVQSHDFLSQATSQIHGNNVILKAEKSIDQFGDIHAQNFSVRSKTMRNSGTINAQSGSIEVEKCVAEPTSVMNIKYLNIKAKNSIDQKGKIKSDGLSIRSNFVNNSGDIESINAGINANRWCWNTGNIAVEESLNINALASINSFDWQLFKDYKMGMIQAKNLTINSALNLNIGGIYQAENAQINSLIDLNVGLYAPQLTSLDDIFTERNFEKTAVTLFMRFLPPPARLVAQSGLTIYSLYNTVGVGYERFQVLKDQENIEISDMMPILCDIKNSSMSTMQLGVMGMEGCGMIYPKTPISSEVENSEKSETQQALPSKMTFIDNMQMVVNDTWKSGQNLYESGKKELESALNFDEMSMKKLSPVFDAANIVGACGPNINRSSVLDVNAGVVLGVNGHSTSVWSGNTGISAFSNANSIDTCYGINHGVYAASHLNIHSVNDFSSQGAFSGFYGISGSVTANNVDIDSKISMVDKLSLKATKNMHLEEDVHASNTSIKANYLNNKGTIHGKLAVDVSTKSYIGNVDCQGELFAYKGPIQEGFADDLATGNGDSLNVSNKSGTAIFAGDQDVHFKEQFDFDDSLIVKTTGDVNADKKITAKGVILFDAGKNVHHASLKAGTAIGILAGGDVVAQSKKEFLGDGKKSDEVVDRVVIEAGTAIGVKAGGDVQYKSVDTRSGKAGTTIFADGNIYDDALILQSNRTNEYEYANKEHRTLHGTTTQASVSSHTSQGDIVAHAKGTCTFVGSQFDADKAFIHGDKGVLLNDVQSKQDCLYDTVKDGGRWGNSKRAHDEVHTSTSQGVHFNTKEKPVISSLQGDILAKNISGTAPIFNVGAGRNVAVLLGAKHYDLTKSEKNSNLVWKSKKEEARKDVTSIPLSVNGQIESNAQKTTVEVLKGQAGSIAEIIKSYGDGSIDQKIVEDVHLKFSHSQVELTNEAKIVLAVAVSTATAGVASGSGISLATALQIKSAIAIKMVTAMTASSITSLANQAAVALVEAKGNPVQAGKALASTDTIKRLAISVSTAGLSGAASQTLTGFGLPDVAQGRNVVESCAYAMPRQVVEATIVTCSNIAQGQHVPIAIKESLRRAAAGTLGDACATNIGKLYKQDKINPVTHKLLHTMTGAVEGGIVGGLRGALAGSVGALVAETTADVFSPKAPTLELIYKLENEIGRKLTEQEFCKYWNHQLQNYMRGAALVASSAKMTTTVVAFVAHQDVSTANLTATTAVDNNFMGLIGAGFVAAGTAYSAKNIYDSYQDNGIDGAFKQLGIEVVTYSVGVVAGRAIGAVAFKCGDMMYPTAQAAINATFDKAPGLKIALGNVAEKLILAGEKLNQTAVGKIIARADAAVINAERQAWNAAGKKVDQVCNKVVTVQDQVLKQVGASSKSVTEQPLSAASRINKIKLHNQLDAEQVANGHAFKKHVIDEAEFPAWIKTKKDYQQYIESLIDQPAKWHKQTFHTSKGPRTYYIDSLENPNRWHKITKNGKKVYYEKSSNCLVFCKDEMFEKGEGSAYDSKKGLNAFFEA